MQLSKNKKIKCVFILIIIVISLLAMFMSNAETIIKKSDISKEDSIQNKSYQETLNEHLLLYSSFETEGSNGLPIDDVQNESYSSVVSGSVYNTTNMAKNGNKSCYFSGSASQRLRLNRNSLNFGTKDFTVEFWAYPLSQVMPYSLFFGNDSNVDFEFFCQDGSSSSYISISIVSYTRMLVANQKYTANKWTKYSVVRKNGVVIVYKDDEEIGRTESYKNYGINLSSLAIGRKFINFKYRIQRLHR